MKVRRLQLDEFEMARIRVETQLAGLSVSYNYRGIKNINHQRPQMTVNRENPSLEVDMESLRNNLGMKNIRVMAQEIVANANSQARQGTKKFNNNGDAVAALPHHGRNPFAEIARRNMLAVRQRVPQQTASDPTVGIKGNPGSFSIDWSIQDVTIIWDDNQAPEIIIDPKPHVNVELAQEARVKFKVVELSIPPETGGTFDEEA